MPCLPHLPPLRGNRPKRFVKQLRNAGYFDTAIGYLDRVSKLPGVDPAYVAAVPLEKAQTHIEAALRSRNSNDRDQSFADAEKRAQRLPRFGRSPPRSPKLGFNSASCNCFARRSF